MSAQLTAITNLSSDKPNGARGKWGAGQRAPSHRAAGALHSALRFSQPAGCRAQPRARSSRAHSGIEPAGCRVPRQRPNDYTFSGLIAAHGMGGNFRRVLELRHAMVRRSPAPRALLCLSASSSDAGFCVSTGDAGFCAAAGAPEFCASTGDAELCPAFISASVGWEASAAQPARAQNARSTKQATLWEGYHARFSCSHTEALRTPLSLANHLAKSGRVCPWGGGFTF